MAVYTRNHLPLWALLIAAPFLISWWIIVGSLALFVVIVRWEVRAVRWAYGYYTQRQARGR